MNMKIKNMKNLRKLLYILTLFSIINVCCIKQSFGQEKVNISVGLGLPELLNMSVRYQLKQTQLGVGLGFIPKPKGEESIISVSADVYYHFAGLSKLSNRRPWYGRIGLDYLKEEDEFSIEQYVYLNLRFGRDYNLSKKFGIQIDAGFIYQLYDETIRKVPPSGWDF